MRIGVTGCAGRMGRMLLHAVLHSPGAELAGGIERSDHPALGSDLGGLAGVQPLGLTAAADAAALFAASDAVIDFSAPAALLLHGPLAATHRTALVVGTTGLASEHRAALIEAARATPVVVAANMSLGVNLLLNLTRRVAEVLGADYDIEIVEMHHRHKVDAPSGTALALGEAAAAGRGLALDAAAVRVRDGHIGQRTAGAIGLATLRGGDVVGEHTVIFAGEGERLELTHKATSRTIFASGAIRAAQWCEGQSPGLYTMRDVLGLN